MSIESLASMTLAELRRERDLAKVQAVQIAMKIPGTRGADRIEIEEALVEAREYIDIIKRRIARLERSERN